MTKRDAVTRPPTGSIQGPDWAFQLAVLEHLERSNTASTLRAL